MTLDAILTVGLSLILSVLIWLRAMPSALKDRGRAYAAKVWLLGLGLAMIAVWRADALMDGYVVRWQASLACWAFIAYTGLHYRQVMGKGALAWWEVRK
ncbi:MAG: hypothetical protein ACK5NN_13265 [Sphingomonadaceae bacterium]